MNAGKDSLYARLVNAGCEVSGHESDLYVRATADARRIVEDYDVEKGGASYSVFRSWIDGKEWLDVPFQYAPWWEARAARYGVKLR